MAEKKSVEKVSHPPHYGGDVPHETYKCLAAWGLTGNAYLWNAAKYISRAGKKGGENDTLTDLKKAKWYLEREIEARAAKLPANLEAARKAFAAVETVRKRIQEGRCGRCGRKKCKLNCQRFEK